MSNKERCFPAIIRFENAGCIIWSQKYRRYYVLEKSIGEKIYQLLLADKMSISDVCKCIPELNEQFFDIGVDDTVRIIDNTKRTQRPFYAPLECYYDFTNKCNLRCDCCYNKKHLGHTTMEPAVISSIMTEMSELGIQRLYVAGGEPTIDVPALKAYIDTAYELGITTSMVTNGTLLTEDLCRYLLSRELVDISVSIDGYDEESSLLRRNDGKFKEAIEGVKMLVRLKKEMGNTISEICVKPIIDRYQDREFFEKMIELTMELGADKVKFANAERSLNHPLGYYSKDVDSYYKTIKMIADLQKEYKDKVVVTNVTNPCVGFGDIGIVGMKGCIGAQELIAINADGRITPCLMNHTVLGNYYDYGSMRNFFDNADSLSTYCNTIVNEECFDCKIYSTCRGGCQVRKIVQTGKIAGKDPICPIENNIALDGVIVPERGILTPVRVSHSL